MNRGQIMPMLLRAARTGDVAKFTSLIEAGADPNWAESKGANDRSTPLHVATASPQCSAAALRRLIELGAAASTEGPQSQSSPFLTAAQLHSIEKLNVLRDAGADIHFVSGAGMNAAVCAAYGPAETSVSVLSLLADWGISLDAESQYGESVVSVLSYRGLFAAVRLAIDRGANPDRLRWSALHYGAAGIAPRGLGIIEPNAGGIEAVDRWQRTPLHVAAIGGNMAIIDSLVARGANPKAQWRCESNALHAAAMGNQPQIVSKLLQLGLNADWADEFGNTALMTALECDGVEAAKVLLASGARLDSSSHVQSSPVHCARTIRCFELLLSAKADLNLVSGSGEWPLRSAAECGDANLVNYLLKHGAQVDLTSTGETALHAAVRSDSLTAITALLDAGANPNARDVDGWTPLFCVQSPEATKLLLGRGGDPSASDQCDLTLSRWIKDPEILAELNPKTRSKQ